MRIFFEQSIFLILSLLFLKQVLCNDGSLHIKFDFGKPVQVGVVDTGSTVNGALISALITVPNKFRLNATSSFEGHPMDCFQLQGLLPSDILHLRIRVGLADYPATTFTSKKLEINPAEFLNNKFATKLEFKHKQYKSTVNVHLTYFDNVREGTGCSDGKGLCNVVFYKTNLEVQVVGYLQSILHGGQFVCRLLLAPIVLSKLVENPEIADQILATYRFHNGHNIKVESFELDTKNHYAIRATEPLKLQSPDEAYELYSVQSSNALYDMMLVKVTAHLQEGYSSPVLRLRYQPSYTTRSYDESFVAEEEDNANSIFESYQNICPPGLKLTVIQNANFFDYYRLSLYPDHTPMDPDGISRWFMAEELETQEIKSVRVIDLRLVRNRPAVYDELCFAQQIDGNLENLMSVDKVFANGIILFVITKRTILKYPWDIVTDSTLPDYQLTAAFVSTIDILHSLNYVHTALEFSSYGQDMEDQKPILASYSHVQSLASDVSVASQNPQFDKVHIRSTAFNINTAAPEQVATKQCSMATNLFNIYRMFALIYPNANSASPEARNDPCSTTTAAVLGIMGSKLPDERLTAAVCLKQILGCTETPDAADSNEDDSTEPKKKSRFRRFFSSAGQLLKKGAKELGSGLKTVGKGAPSVGKTLGGAAVSRMMQPSYYPPYQGQSSNLGLILGIVIVLILILAGGVGFLIYYLRNNSGHGKYRRSRRKTIRMEESDEGSSSDEYSDNYKYDGIYESANAKSDDNVYEELPVSKRASVVSQRAEIT